MSDKAPGFIHFSRQEDPEQWGADWPVDYARANPAAAPSPVSEVEALCRKFVEPINEAKYDELYYKAHGIARRLELALDEQERSRVLDMLTRAETRAESTEAALRETRDRLTRFNEERERQHTRADEADGLLERWLVTESGGLVEAQLIADTELHLDSRAGKEHG